MEGEGKKDQEGTPPPPPHGPCSPEHISAGSLGVWGTGPALRGLPSRLEPVNPVSPMVPIPGLTSAGVFLEGDQRAPLPPLSERSFLLHLSVSVRECESESALLRSSPAGCQLSSPSVAGGAGSSAAEAAWGRGLARGDAGANGTQDLRNGAQGRAGKSRLPGPGPGVPSTAVPTSPLPK